MATTITANGINFPDGSASAPSIGGTDTNTGLFTGSDIVGFATGGNERLRIDSGGNVQVNGGAVHVDANGELAVFESDTNLAFTNSGKLSFDYSGNIARIRSTHNGSGTTRNLGLYIANTLKILLTATQVKVNKEIIVGLQGGNDVTKIGGGSGIGAYVQLEHASSGINTKLMGNNHSYLNQFHGNLAIGEDDPDGNKLLIRAASTVGTKNGHIMLTGDSATVGQGPQIVFSESGSGSSYAGGYVGFVRQGGNSVGDLVFGTRNAQGDVNTIPTERLRITSTGLFGFNNTSPGGACIDATHSRTNAYGTTSDNRGLAQIVARNASDAPGRFASISLVSGGGTQAEASINLVQTGNYQGDLTFKSRTAVSAWTEKLRITSSGLLLLGTTDSSGYSNRCAYFDNANHGDNWNYVSITGSTSGGAGIVFGDSTGQDGGNYESYMYHNNSSNDFSIVTDRGNKEFRFLQGGDLSIIDGNLKVASGHGIDFSATSDGPSQGNETLDDYERGTYNPQGLAWSGSDWVTVTFDSISRYGRYTKIGGLVHVQGYLSNFHVDSSFDGQLAGITLPFTAVNATGMYSVGVTTHSTAFSSSGYTSFFVNVGAAAMYSMQENTTSYNTWSGSSGRHLMFQVSYMCE